MRTGVEALTIGGSVRRVSRTGPYPGFFGGVAQTGSGAVFVGDLVHTPLQISRPNDCCSFRPKRRPPGQPRCRPRQGRAVGAAVFPAHFAGHGATTIAPRGRDYAITRWERFDEV